MEVPKSTVTAALFLEPGILPIQYEIERRQLVFLKNIQGDDPVKMIYHEMLKYQAMRSWTDNRELQISQRVRESVYPISGLCGHICAILPHVEWLLGPCGRKVAAMSQMNQMN